MRVAVEHVRRMRGGAQAHLMRCDDGAYYIVKFQNNPQHLRVLANEMLATRLAARLGIAVPQVEVIDVRPELIANTSDLVVQLGLGRTPCAAGKQFGSQYPGHPARLAVHDFLPDEQLAGVQNLADFLGVLVLDKWTCNTNGRQSIFFREAEGPAGIPGSWSDPAGTSVAAAAVAPGPGADSAPRFLRGYTAMMIDFGFCFNAGEWDFPDAPLRGLYARHAVYQGVAGIGSFEPWLARLEEQMTERALGEEAAQIPPEWYAADWSALERLLERLYRRREPFPNWKVKYA